MHIFLERIVDVLIWYFSLPDTWMQSPALDVVQWQPFFTCPDLHDEEWMVVEVLSGVVLKSQHVNVANIPLST